jgi:ABC-type antimicrobial peptide transport system permease subunit
MRTAVAGLAAGIVGALAATQLLRGLLFELSPFDPATYAGAAAILLATAAIASLVPARRAARSDPMAALRSE